MGDSVGEAVLLVQYLYLLSILLLFIKFLELLRFLMLHAYSIYYTTGGTEFMSGKLFTLNVANLRRYLIGIDERAR